MKKTPFILSIMFVVFLIVVFSTIFSGLKMFGVREWPH